MRIFIALTLFLSSQALADDQFFVEPYVGLYDAVFKSSTSNSPNVGGYGYGVRGGIGYYSLQLGLDYMTGKMKDDQGPQDTVTPELLGVILAYKFPAYLRLYAEYFFNDKWTFDNGVATHSYEGTELRLGVGLTFIPYVNVNIEQTWGSLDKDNGSTMTNPYKTRISSITLSVPFEF